jgi:hypothetical protein
MRLPAASGIIFGYLPFHPEPVLKFGTQKELHSMSLSIIFPKKLQLKP